MNRLKVGDIVTGNVTGIEKYGIFVNVNEYNGLIHISEISNDFVKNVNDYAQLREEIKARVLDIDENNKQLKLSIKEFNIKKSKAKKNKIKETSKGFSTLAQNLNGWILEKVSEINFKK